jgi:hypothetical protein
MTTIGTAVTFCDATITHRYGIVVYTTDVQRVRSRVLGRKIRYG